MIEWNVGVSVGRSERFLGRRRLQVQQMISPDSRSSKQAQGKKDTTAAMVVVQEKGKGDLGTYEKKMRAGAGWRVPQKRRDGDQETQGREYREGYQRVGDGESRT